MKRFGFESASPTGAAESNQGGTGHTVVPTMPKSKDSTGTGLLQGLLARITSSIAQCQVLGLGTRSARCMKLAVDRS